MFQARAPLGIFLYRGGPEPEAYRSRGEGKSVCVGLHCVGCGWMDGWMDGGFLFFANARGPRAKVGYDRVG